MMKSLCKLILVSALCTFWHVGKGVIDDFYSITVEDADGQNISLQNYKNKVLLIVNVASECGYTDSHYKELVQLQQQFGRTGHFQALGFPCNQFGGQEPKGVSDILHFVRKTYGVNFPLFNKVHVIGSDAANLWKYLQEKTQKVPSWNFWKYLIDHEGNVQGAWGPQTSVNELVPLISQAVKVAIANKPVGDGNHRKHMQDL